VDPIELATVQRSLDAPDPDDPRKPAWPWLLDGPSWAHALRRTAAELGTSRVFDLAAGLSFYSVLSLFPALLAVLSTLAVFGYGDQTVAWLLALLREYAPADVYALVAAPISHLATVSGAGLVFVASLLVALWSASGYVAAFGRALNWLYGVVEGRPLWAIIPYNLGVTLVMLAFGALAVVAVVLSSEAVDVVAGHVALPPSAVESFRDLRWPYLVIGSLVFVVSLYHVTPNVRQPRLRWSLVGGVLAVAALMAGVLGFSAWVVAFPLFNATYGVIGSFIVLLLGLFVMNLAVLVGAVLNMELERVRELVAGFHAEDAILLPPRATRMIHSHARSQSALIRAGIQLRVDHLIRRRASDLDGAE